MFKPLVQIKACRLKDPFDDLWLVGSRLIRRSLLSLVSNCKLNKDQTWLMEDLILLLLKRLLRH